MGVETHQRAVHVSGLVRQHYDETGEGMTLEELAAKLDFASPPPEIVGLRAAIEQGLVRYEWRFFPVER